MKQEHYSRSAMKAMLNRLPHGTMKEIADKLALPYHTVANVCHGKHFKKEVVEEVERRYRAAVREFQKQEVRQ